MNKGGSPYPPNSVVVGMFEGYYSYPEVGGVPCPPKITHALEKLLPPQSLLEVNRLEVSAHASSIQLTGCSVTHFVNLQLQQSVECFTAWNIS